MLKLVLRVRRAMARLFRPSEILQGGLGMFMALAQSPPRRRRR